VIAVMDVMYVAMMLVVAEIMEGDIEMIMTKLGAAMMVHTMITAGVVIMVEKVSIMTMIVPPLLM
jgi:hypothetical protein